ncbi:MAG: type II secretion system protein [Ilumatobacteraceae bacterium]|nr:type II secretion system protein [Ilumatobacteraceae bacterium]
MNIHSSNIQGQSDGEREDKGFTLIEILIAIVLVGILSAVAVVGISNLVSKGSTSACNASLDAAKAGSAVYLAELSTYPPTLALLANGTYLTLPTGITTNAAAVVAAPPHPAAAIGMQTAGVGVTWRLTMLTAGTATQAPTFGCT